MVIVGDGSIGKTCLLHAIKASADNDDEDVTSGAYSATIAENSLEKWEYQGNMYNVDVWDTAGQEAFAKLRKMAYPQSNVVVVAFDMTSKNSLDNILNGQDAWIQEIRNVVAGFSSWIVVGTKHDLWEEGKVDEDKTAVTMEDVYKVAEACDAKAVFMTSARTRHNVRETQQAILRVGIDNNEGKATPNWKRPASSAPPASESTESKEPAAAAKDPVAAPAKSADTKPTETKSEKSSKANDAGCCVLL